MAARLPTTAVRCWWAAAATHARMAQSPGSARRALASSVLEKQSTPTVEEFVDLSEALSKPLLLRNYLRGATNNHTCMHRWASCDAFVSRVLESGEGDVGVAVEVGENYMDPTTARVEMPLTSYAAYLNLTSDNDPPASSERAYLAQHDIFVQRPHLLEDLPTPPYCTSTGRGDRCAEPPCRAFAFVCSVSPHCTIFVTCARATPTPHRYGTMLWLGPSGTRSPLHQDPYHNLYTQIFGSKTLWLYPATTPREWLYISSNPMQENTSTVPVEDVDVRAKFPNFTMAQRQDGAAVVRVGPGDALFLPKGWWHYVRADTKALSVSFWWL